ncbi:elongation factor P [Candidatus Gottesmanbacteria bacterium]|nr:elongation factor P [Candidatus Gottesmanbacteria bacterium]
MGTITTAQFRKGIFIEFKGEPHQIVDMQFVNPGKGSAFVRTSLKSLKTGKVQDFTYKSGESATEVPIETHEMQYLYQEGDKYVFMDNFTFEQYHVPATILEDYLDYLKPNDTYQILVHGETPMGIRFPKKVRLKVIHAEEGARGDTVSGAGKVVEVETRLKVTVPLFIKEGDVIAIDTETGQYLERA